MSSDITVADIVQDCTNSQTSIKVSNLSKVYQLYRRPEDRLKQSILPRVKRLFGLESPNYYQDFFALNDVSFEAKRGETIGIIGRNGAGKSTILQIICGTLSPSGGSVETFGRVAALLELGSGFNPEFTGVENIYMNASILGLTKSEIDDRFDQIVKFADIGDFIHQPVKIYSSGMYVRLAFAIIAHVDADILVVDEALAVGDAVFTQKCMRFIREFQKNGTLIFVSHDTASVQNLCERAIWLLDGNVAAYGTSKSVAEKYLYYTSQQTYGDDYTMSVIDKDEEPVADEVGVIVDGKSFFLDYGAETTTKDNLESAGGWKTGVADIKEVTLDHIESENRDKSFFTGGERVRLKIGVTANNAIEKPIVGFLWRDKLGQDLFGENTLPVTDIRPIQVSAGAHINAYFDFRLPMLPNGEYSITVAVAEGDVTSHVHHHFLHDAMIVTISSSNVRWGLVGVPFERIQLENEHV